MNNWSKLTIKISIKNLIMKLISASIIVLTGTILILGGAYIQHDGTQLFVMATGCGVGAIGLWGWFSNLKEK